MQTPLSVLQLIPTMDTGGAEQTTLEVADAIARAGGRAYVMAEPGRLTPRLRDVGAEVVDFPAATKNPARIIWNARAIAAFVSANGIRIVHARSRAPAWSGFIAARRAGVQFVTTYHGAYGETNALKSAYNSVMARGDRVIANSEFTAALIRSRYGVAADRLRVIHRGIEPADFTRTPAVSARAQVLRQQWGVPDAAPIVLQLARLTSWKGHTTVIDAFAQLVQDSRHSAARLVLAGDAQGRTAYQQMLEAQAIARGVADRVLFVGHVPLEAVPAALEAAHTVVIASTKPEAFGRSVIEAQVMARPVIATRIGAPPETVKSAPDVARDAATGWLIPPDDVTALAQALEAALSLSPEDYTGMGARGRANVLANFTVKGLQDKTLAVYRELLGG